MAQDAQSEFDRIFGKTQRESEHKPQASNPSSGVTQKLPSDSDLLGIRTDSDRFIAKRDLPETLPAEGAQKPAVDPEAKTTAQDAMTIALNVNVFANIADAKKTGEPGGDKTQISGTVSELLGKKPGEMAGGSTEGATFVIPLPKDAGKGTDASKPSAASKSSIADEFTRILNPKNIPAGPASNTEFTRVLHVEESVKVPKPAFQSPAEEPAAASTINVTSDPKLPATLPPEPVVVTPPGPSAFTKVVKGSELRTLQEKLAAAAGHQPAGWQSPLPTPVVPPGSQPWQSPQGAPVPQYIPAPGNQWPGSSQSASMPSQAPQQSKLSQYMPLIIVLNLLVLMAILLIFFFAIKK